MYECCPANIVSALRDIYYDVCATLLSARCKDHLAISLQCLHDSTVILLS